MAKELNPRRTVTAGQGSENVEMTKNEISKLTALSGLMSIFMFGTDAVDLFNEENLNTAQMAKSMKSKSGKGLFPSLKDIADATQVLNKPESVINQTVKKFEQNFVKFANFFAKDVKIAESVKSIADGIYSINSNIHKSLVHDNDEYSNILRYIKLNNEELQNIVNAINNNENTQLLPESILDGIIENIGDITNIQTLLTQKLDRKISDIISAISTLTPDKQEDKSTVSKILIELNGTTDLSKLIEQLYILNDKDISDETIGIIAKLDKIVNAVKNSISQSLDIDISGALNKITDLNEYVKAVQQIIASIQSLQLEKSVGTEIINSLRERLEEIIEALNQINIQPELITKLSDTTDTLKSISQKIQSFETSIKTLNDVSESLSNIKLSKVPEILDVSKSIFIGEFVSRISESASKLSDVDLTQFHKDFSIIVNIISNIISGVESYNNAIGKTTEIKLNHFTWHSIPDVLTPDSDRFFGKFISDILHNLNLIAILDYSDTARLLHEVGQAYKAVYDGIEDYNQQIAKENIEISSFNIDESQLKDLQINVNKLIHFIASFDELMNGKISNKLLSNVDNDIEQLISSTSLIDKLNKAIEDINKLDIQLDEFKYSISENFGLELNEFLVKLNLLNKVFDSNKFEISNELEKFLTIITSIRDMMFKLNAYSFASKNAKQRINLEHFAYSINEDFIKELKEFVNSLNKITPTFNEKEAKELDSFIALFGRISSSLFELQNNIIKNPLVLDENTLNNFTITNEFNTKWIELNEKIGNLIKSDKIDIKAIQEVVTNIELLKEIGTALNNLKDLTIDTAKIDEVLSNISTVIESVKNFPDISKKLILSKDITVNIIKSFLHDLNMNDEIDAIGDINKIVSAKSYIEELSKFANNLMSISLPDQKGMEQKIMQFVGIKKILDVLSQFEPIEIGKIQLGSFIDDINKLAQMHISPEDIEWILPVVRRLENVNDVIEKIDIKNLSLFSEAIAKLSAGFKGIEEININAVKNNLAILGSEDFKIPNVKLFEDLDNMISHINNLSKPDIERIKELNTFLGDSEQKDTLRKLCNNVGELLKYLIKSNDDFSKMETISKVLKNGIEILVSVTQIKETPNKKALIEINKLVEQDGLLKQILDNIRKNFTQEVSRDAEKNLKLINDLFDSVTKLGEIGLRKKIRMKMNLWFIKNFLMDDIISILKTINKSGKKIQGELKDEKLFKPFISLLDAITKLTELNDVSKTKMISSLWWIKHFIADMTMELIGQLAESAKEIESSDVSGHMKSLKDFVETLPAIANFGLKKLISYTIKVDLLKSFIKSSVQELIDTVINLQGTEAAKISAENTKDMIDFMNEVFGALPGIKSILTYLLKTSTISLTVMPFMISYTSQVRKMAEIAKLIDIQLIEKTKSIIIELNNAIVKFDLDYRLYTNQIKDAIKTIKSVDKLLDVIIDLSKTAKEIDVQTIQKVNAIITSISQINLKDLAEATEYAAKSKEFVKNIKPLLKLGPTLALLGKLADVAEHGADSINKLLDKIIEGVHKFDQIDEKSIKKMQDSLNAFEGVVIKAAAILFIGAIAMNFIKVENIVGFSLALTGFVLGIGFAMKQAAKFVSDASDTINAFARLVLISGGILILGSIIFEFLDAANVLGFTLILTGFIFAVSKAYQIASKSMASSMESARDFANLVAISGIILIMGSIVAHLVTVGDLLAFTGSLLLLIGGTIGIYALASNLITKDITEATWNVIYLILAGGLTLTIGSLVAHMIDIGDLVSFTLMLLTLIGGTMAVYVGVQYGLKALGVDEPQEIAESYIKLVVASGLLLAIGSLITSIVSFGDILTFTLMLGTFIGGTMLVYTICNSLMDDAKKGYDEFSKILIVSGILLMIGSLLTKLIGIKPVLAFTAMLGLFIGTTMLVYAIASHYAKDSMKGLKDFGILVIASGILLMIGALLVKHIGWEPIAAFGLILAAFVTGIMTIYVIASKKAKDALKGAAEFGALVVCASISLFIGALTMKEFGGVGEAMLVLGGYALVLLTFVAGLIGIYTLFGKRIEKSIAPAAMMGVIAVLSSVALAIGIATMDKYPNGADQIFQFVAADLILIGGLSLLAMIMGKAGLQTMVLGSVILGVIVGIAALSGLVIGMIADIGNKYDLSKVWVVMGQIGVLIAGLTAIAAGLGAIAMTGIGAAIILAGVGLLASIVGVAWLAAEAMKAIGEAMLVMQKVKSFDPKPIISGVKAFVDIAQELEPLADQAGKIIKASIAISTLSVVLSKISEAVQDYAELKVPVYEGTKVVEYRQLNKKDFKSAGENVKLIIETLGGAVMESYDKHPDMFETNWIGTSVFSKVTVSLSKLGPMLSRIASSVKDYASLKVPVYKEGTTEIETYRELNKTDFQNAGNNVKLIIETLGGAVMEAYDAHPDMFETNWIGTSVFSKVTVSLGKLGPMLSKIARSVSDYASLKVPIKWDKDGNATEYEHLKQQHFSDAANNVKLIIDTLGGAIIKAYEEHPDYYETSGGFLGFGGSSPFGKTIDANMKLAKLISKISISVRDFASSQVPIAWDKDGNATDWEHLEQKHFQAASDCIVTVITTLGEAVIKAGQKMDEVMSPRYFKKVVDAQGKLGDLISKISKSVLEFASGKVPTGYDKDGNALGYEELSNKHFSKASDCIITVITTLGEAVMKSGEKMDEIMSPKKFKKVVEAQSTLGDLISKISESVLNFASGKVPTGYDKDGNVLGYESLGPTHFRKASDAINEIITTLGRSIMESYEKHEDWFDDGEDSDFAMACKAIGSMGGMISEIATGIQAYADLKIPMYDASGAITGYKPIGKPTFTAASQTIGEIITTLGHTIMEEYEKHDDWFDDGPESDMAMAASAIGSMGSMLSSIAQGIQSYAELLIPDKWDETGKPIHFRQMKHDDFVKAGDSVAKVVSTLGKAIMNIYVGKDYSGNQIIDAKLAKQMFEFDPDKQSDSPFNKVVEGCTNMGEMISSIAEGVQMYATLNMPSGFDANGKPTGYEKLDPKVFGQAATNIGLVISTIGNAIMSQFGAHKNWFELPPLKQKGGFLGLCDVEAPNPGEPPFIKVMKGLGMMGGVIASIAEGVQVFANGKMPKYENGQIVGYQPIGKTTYTAAAKAISDVITIMGQTLSDVYDKHYQLFFGERPKKIMEVCTKMGQVISGIARGIQTYANMKYATDWDPQTGRPIKWEKIKDDDFKKAAITISEVLKTMAKAVAEAADDKIFANSDISLFSLISGKSNRVTNMLNSVNKASVVLSSVALTIQRYANMKYATAWDKDGKATAWTKMTDDDFTNAADTIKYVLKTIAEAVAEAADDDIFSENGGGFLAIITGKTNKVTNMLNAVNKSSVVLSSISSTIQKYANLKFATKWDKNSKPIAWQLMNSKDIDNAAANIKTVLTSIGQAIVETVDGNEEIFGDNIYKSPAYTAAKAVGKIGETLNTIAQSIAYYAKSKFPIYEWKNGKLNTTLYTLKEADYANAENVIKRVTLCLGETLSNIYNTNQQLFDTKDGNPIGNIIKGLNEMVKVIKDVAKQLQELTKIDITKITKTLSDQASSIESSVGYVADSNYYLTTGWTIVNNKSRRNPLVSLQNESDKKLVEGISPALTTIVGAIKALFNNMIELEKEWNKAKAPIESMKSFSLEVPVNVITESYEKIKELQDKMTTITEGIFGQKKTSIDKIDPTPIIDNIVSVHKIVVNIINAVVNWNKRFGGASFDNSNVLDTVSKATDTIANVYGKIKDLQDKMTTITEGIFGQKKTSIAIINSLPIISNIKSVEQIVEAVFNAINIWKEHLQSVADISLETSVMPLLSSFAGVAEMAKTLSSSLEDSGDNANASLQQWFSGMTAEENNPSVFENINALNASIADLIAVASTAEQYGSNGYKTIADGIDKVQGAINNIKGLNTFAQHREILDKYVKTINSISQVKIDSMTNFVNSMNKLANKMGNLDGLTNAIAENLTSVLDKLTIRMEDAKKTIIKSEELQDKRQKRMEKTISNIKSIMNQKLTIEISNVSDTEGLGGTPTTPTTQTNPDEQTGNVTTTPSQIQPATTGTTSTQPGTTGTISTPTKTTPTTTSTPAPNRGNHGNSRPVNTNNSEITEILKIVRQIRENVKGNNTRG